MLVKELENKRILIVGYGKEGVVTERFLREKIPNCHIEIADINRGEDYLNNQNKFDIAIKSPGISSKKLKIKYTTATNLFFGNLGNNTVIGVTGSKGKSTTSTLIYKILEKSNIKTKLVGNIGEPALGALLYPPSEKTVFVYELSSYQLADIQYSPHISVFVSLFPEHIDFHRSYENYINAKFQIIQNATNKDYFIYNPKYPELAQFAKKLFVQSIPFEEDFIPKYIKLLGSHNLDNIRGAITVARLMKIPDQISENVITNFEPLKHRLENIGVRDGVTYYDDAISTTPESTHLAIQTLSEIKTIFLGGLDRGYDFTKLVSGIKKSKIENIVFFPNSGETIFEEMKRQGYLPKNHIFTNNMEEAVKFARKFTISGFICLLSTASPSYSVWKNFEEKGDLFRKFVFS